jgi:hypothetical protein
MYQMYIVKCLFRMNSCPLIVGYLLKCVALAEDDVAPCIVMNGFIQSLLGRNDATLDKDELPQRVSFEIVKRSIPVRGTDLTKHGVGYIPFLEKSSSILN